MKKWFTLVAMALMAVGANAQELTVADKQKSGCLGMTRSSEDEPMPIERIPTIILQKEGNVLSVELQNYTSNCATADFEVNSSFSEGSEGSPSILSVNVIPVTGEELADCICTFNVSFTVRDLEVNSFYLKCWWYEGLVELTEGEPLVLEYRKEEAFIDGASYQLLKVMHKAMLLTWVIGEKELHIPSEVSYEGETYTVTCMASFGSNSFGEKVTKVFIPNTIRSMDFDTDGVIYSNPFGGCTSLESIEVDEDCPLFSSVDGVLFNKDKTKLINYPAASPRETYTVPEWVTTVWPSAFTYLQHLRKLTISDNVTSIGYGLFWNSKSLEEVRLPSGLKVLESNLFNNCQSLKSVQIPESVTKINNNVFEGCSALTDITLPQGLTSIGNSAFYKCSALQTLDIPKSVKRIYNDAFSGCKQLSTLYIRGVLESFCMNRDLFSGMGKQAKLYVTSSEVEKFQAIYDGEVYALPDHEAGFFDFEGFSYKVLSKSDNTVCLYGPIEEDQLGGDVQIPDVVSYEGQDYIVTKISSKAFFECDQLMSIKLPDNITEIGDFAFTRCYQLKIINLPKNLKRIGEYAFLSCSQIEELSLPSTLTDISKYAFTGCSGLRSLLVDDGNPAFLCEDGVLFNHDKTTLVLFLAQNDKTHYDIPVTVTTISPTAFSGSKLESITLPPTLTEIGDGSLAGLTQLKSVSIPASVAAIGKLAFDNCKSLREIEIPNSVQSIGSAAFIGCTSLTKVLLPEGLVRIEGFLFDGCTSLSEVNIPEGVNYIGLATFRNCSHLPALQLPQSVTIIDDEAIKGCTSLTEFTIPDKVESVGWDAFVGCSGLEKLTIGRSVKELGGGTFYGCDNIRQVWSYIEEPFDVVDFEYKPGDMLLYGRCFPESVTREAVLNVPQGTKEKYLAKRGWRDFQTINETISTDVKALSSGKDKHSDYYDLNGNRKQGRLAPGLYIQNGKKIIIK